MSFQSAFSNAIYYARTQSGLTQTKVAEAANISLRWYQKLETGRYKPSAEVMTRIFLVLGIKLEALREEVDSDERMDCGES